MQRRNALILSLILALAFVIRLLLIKLMPLNIDEAKLLEETLKIDWSAIPVQFAGHGTGEYFVLGALVWPFIKIFGFDPLLSLRFIVLGFNIGFIVTLYYFTKYFFHNVIALVACFFSAIWPWGILAGTIGFGAHLMPVMGLGAMMLLLKYTNQKKAHQVITAFILFALMFYTYPSAVFWVPIILISFTVVYGKKLLNRDVILSFIALIIFIFPVIILYLKNQFGWISIDQFLFFRITDLRETRFDEVSIFSVYQSEHLIWRYLGNYLSHYYFPLLHSDLFTGKIILYFMTFIWDSIFIYTGLYLIIKKWKRYRLLLLLLLLYPIGTSLTVISEGISFTRDIMIMPVLLILSALGCVTIATSIANVLKKKSGSPKYYS